MGRKREEGWKKMRRRRRKGRREEEEEDYTHAVIQAWILSLVIDQEKAKRLTNKYGRVLSLHLEKSGCRDDISCKLISS